MQNVSSLPQASEPQQTSSAALMNMQDFLQWHLRRWNNRLRLTRLFVWVPRGLLVGVIISLAIATASRLYPWLVKDELIRLSLMIGAASAVLSVVAVWFWPRPLAKSARHFDQHFGLQERLSTAVELSNGQIDAPQMMMDYQMEDTRRIANGVQAKRFLPVEINWPEIAMLLLAIIGLILAIALKNPLYDEVREREALDATIAQQIEALEQAKNEIESNPNLTEEEKDILTEPLDEAIETLNQDGISQEEAVAALAEAEKELQELGSGMSQEEQQANQQAGEQLSDSSLTDQVGEQLADNNLDATADELDQLADDLDNMTPEEQQEVADQLEEAADALENTNPAVSQQLQQAADALRNGDVPQAQEALNQAADTLRQQDQANQNNAQAQAAEEAANQVEESRQEVTQQGQEGQEGSQSQQGQDGQQSQDGQQGQQDQQGQQSQQNQDGQQGQDGQQSQDGQQGQQSQQGQQDQEGQQGQQGGQQPDQTSQQGQDGQQGQNGESQQGGEQPGQGGQEGSQSGQEGQSGSGGQSDGQSSQQGTGGQSGPSGGSGAGEGSGGEGVDTQSGQSGDQPGDIDNGPGNDDMRDYESVYSPTRIGENGQGEQVGVNGQPTDDNGEPVEPGDFNENFDAESTVPYQEVFRQYEEAMQQALESGYIPISLRDIIHAYFSSLEP